MPRTRVVFYQEEDGTVPLLEWFDGLIPKARVKCRLRIDRLFHGDTAAVVSHGIVKERIVPPKEIEQAIVRKRRFIQDPKRYAYEEVWP